MSNESAYTKRLAPETTMDQVEGLLEHFNLPPKTITFIRANKRILQIILGLIVVIVVAGSLYGSHKDKIKEESATALSLAMNGEPSLQQAALQGVVDNYKGSSAAQWARVELAHLSMKNGDYGIASEQYGAVLSAVKEDNPLFGLLLFGKAQALEAQKSFGDATAQYEKLKDIKGYEHLAYVGMGRIEEEQGDINRAIAVYNNFLLAIGDDPALAQAREEMNSRITRLKAAL